MHSHMYLVEQQHRALYVHRMSFRCRSLSLSQRCLYSSGCSIQRSTSTSGLRSRIQRFVSVSEMLERLQLTILGAQQRIENLRRQNVVGSDQCVVSIENFIAELVPDMYFDLGYVLLSDPLNSIELHLFTQAIPVPIEYVYQARDRTPTDYPLKWSGYMVTIGEILHSQLPFVNPEDWHEMMSGTSRRDIIYATCKSLAYMYKQRLNRKQ